MSVTVSFTIYHYCDYDLLAINVIYKWYKSLFSVVYYELLHLRQ